jgi:multicomponent K+:H+ antiporter subunit A
VAPHEPPRWMKIPVEVLVVLCVAVGMFPAWTVAPVLHAGAGAILGDAMPAYSLSVWHGINTPLLMSLAGIAGGIVLYFGLRRLFGLHANVRRSLGRHVFRWNMEALYALAGRFTRRIANGSLQRSLLFLVLAALIAGAAPFVAGDALPPQWRTPQPMPLLGWLLWLVLVVCAVWTIRLYRQRLLAVVVLGGAGLVVSLTFVFLSAPDLALTQLMVEMVSLVLLLLGLHYLPPRSPPERTPRRRLRDIVVALAAGTGVGLLAYQMMTRPADTISGELLARSLPEAYGANVVNVILVDFRGFDTFGEITVFGIAALIVHALLRRARMAPEKIMSGLPVKLPVPADLAQIMFPLTLTVSVFLFLRGHNAPGGGFIAGLVLAVPLLVQYVIQGAASVESRFGFDYVRCIGVGLIIAGLSGVASMGFGVPFLTSGHLDLELPVIGTVPLASAIGFDTGVYLVVFGGAMLILSMMGTIRPSRTRVSHLGVMEPGERSTRTGELR